MNNNLAYPIQWVTIPSINHIVICYIVRRRKFILDPPPYTRPFITIIKRRFFFRLTIWVIFPGSRETLSYLKRKWVGHFGLPKCTYFYNAQIFAAAYPHFRIILPIVFYCLR